MPTRIANNLFACLQGFMCIHMHTPTILQVQGACANSRESRPGAAVSWPGGFRIHPACARCVSPPRAYSAETTSPLQKQIIVGHVTSRIREPCPPYPRLPSNSLLLQTCNNLFGGGIWPPTLEFSGQIIAMGVMPAKGGPNYSR